MPTTRCSWPMHHWIYACCKAQHDAKEVIRRKFQSSLLGKLNAHRSSVTHCKKWLSKCIEPWKHKLSSCSVSPLFSNDKVEHPFPSLVSKRKIFQQLSSIFKEQAKRENLELRSNLHWYRSLLWPLSFPYAILVLLMSDHISINAV